MILSVIYIFCFRLVVARRYTWEWGLGLRLELGLGLKFGFGLGLRLRLELTIILTPNLILILTYSNPNCNPNPPSQVYLLATTVCVGGLCQWRRSANKITCIHFDQGLPYLPSLPRFCAPFLDLPVLHLFFWSNPRWPSTWSINGYLITIYRRLSMLLNTSPKFIRIDRRPSSAGILCPIISSTEKELLNFTWTEAVQSIVTCLRDYANSVSTYIVLLESSLCSFCSILT